MLCKEQASVITSLLHIITSLLHQVLLLLIIVYFSLLNLQMNHIPEINQQNRFSSLLTNELITNLQRKWNASVGMNCPMFSPFRTFLFLILKFGVSMQIRMNVMYVDWSNAIMYFYSLMGWNHTSEFADWDRATWRNWNLLDGWHLGCQRLVVGYCKCSGAKSLHLSPYYSFDCLILL